MSGTSYRPRPDNGSGDSPRPPFLTEFVNHIREVFFAHAVYHLIGGALAMRVHSHVERPFRLKTESSRSVLKLHGADADVGQKPVRGICRNVFGYFSKARVQESDLRPVVFQLWWRLTQALPRDFQRVRVF